MHRAPALPSKRLGASSLRPARPPKAHCCAIGARLRDPASTRRSSRFLCRSDDPWSPAGGISKSARRQAPSRACWCCEQQAGTSTTTGRWQRPGEDAPMGPCARQQEPEPSLRRDQTSLRRCSSKCCSHPGQPAPRDGDAREADAPRSGRKAAKAGRGPSRRGRPARLGVTDALLRSASRCWLRSAEYPAVLTRPCSNFAGETARAS